MAHRRHHLRRYRRDLARGGDRAGDPPGRGGDLEPPAAAPGHADHGQSHRRSRGVGGDDPAALAYDVFFAATVQEEIGLVGASSLRHDLDADLALALDNGLVGDVPAVGARRMPTALGAGPTLVHKDHYVHYSVDLIWRLAAVAEREQIPIQHAVYDGFGSDGAALIRQGIPAALIAPATRYTHSAFEMIDERDVVATMQLLRAFITTPPGASAS